MISSTTCTGANPQIEMGGIVEPVASDTSNSVHAFAYGQFNCISQADSSSVPSVTGGFTYGEMVMSALLLLILSCALTLTYFFHFRKIRIKN